MGDDRDVATTQIDICRRFQVDPVSAPDDLKVGIALNVRTGLLPINGLRHPPRDDTTGWYIWAGGEPSDNPNFFEPLHVKHLVEWCPEVLPYLQLPPGWRFLIAPGVEAVWQDPTLLEVT